MVTNILRLVKKSPVIFRFSGVHHNSVSCDSTKLINKVQSTIAEAEKFGQLFPKKLKLARIYNEEDASDSLRENGGWSDLRDVLLCLNMTLTA